MLPRASSVSAWRSSGFRSGASDERIGDDIVGRG